MKRTSRVVVVGAGAVTAVLLSIAAAAWACTPSHTGAHWFCTVAAGCVVGDRISAWDDQANIWLDIDNAAASTQYTLKFRSGSNQGDACHDTPTGNWGNVTTDSGGDAVAQINTTGFSVASYTSCPISGTSASGTAPTHTNFSIIS